jgi:hypothetical protein
MPENPPIPQAPGYDEPPPPPEPARKRRISRNGVLITVLAAAVVAGLVLIGTAPGTGKAHNTGLAESASPAAGPSATAGPPSLTPSSKAATSASPSASHKADKGDTNTPSDRNRAGCGPHPSACGFPDSSNTGVPAGTKLAVLKGDQKITKAGTVIDRKDIRGCVDIEAPRVTIRRSKIACPDFYVVASFGERYRGGGLLIEDSTVTCGNGPGTGIGSYGTTVLRVDISGCENGFDIDNTFTVRDSFVHDPYSTEANHADGAQLNPGSHITLTHNTIFMPDSTSAIISNPNGNADVLISDNLMSGGAYTLYCPRDHSTDFRVIDNRVSTVAGPKGGEYGPWTDCAKAAQVTGNVWDATLKPLAAD